MKLMCTCVHIRSCVCACVRMLCVCVCVRMLCVCVYACLCVHMHICVHVHVWDEKCVHAIMCVPLIYAYLCALPHTFNCI